MLVIQFIIPTIIKNSIMLYINNLLKNIVFLYNLPFCVWGITLFAAMVGTYFLYFGVKRFLKNSRRYLIYLFMIIIYICTCISVAEQFYIYMNNGLIEYSDTKTIERGLLSRLPAILSNPNVLMQIAN